MKQLLILSGKGGTGKTTVASAFIELSEAKAFADCDVDAPNLHLVTQGLEEKGREDYWGLPVAHVDSERCIACGRCKLHCRFGAVEFLDGKAHIVEEACEGCGVCEISCPFGLISMRPHVSGELSLYGNEERIFSTAKLRMGSGTSGKLVTEVKQQMQNEAPVDTELAVIDGSPGIGCPVIASLSGVDMVLIVAEPSLSGRSDMERIVLTARGFGVKTAVCVNRADLHEGHTAAIRALCAAEGLPYLGEIPFDKEAVRLSNEGKTLAGSPSPAGEAVRSIYEQCLALLQD